MQFELISGQQKDSVSSRLGVFGAGVLHSEGWSFSSKVTRSGHVIEGSSKLITP